MGDLGDLDDFGGSPCGCSVAEIEEAGLFFRRCESGDNFDGDMMSARDDIF